MTMARRTVVAGGAAFLAGKVDAAAVALTPEHAGRYMRTREGEQGRTARVRYCGLWL